jgi:hypothetical protein
MARTREHISQLGDRAISSIIERGKQLGFEVETELPVQGGRIDVVWFLRELTLPGNTIRLPVVAFEVESSWRTRKHVKGDYLNLADLGASLGVILLLGEGENVESLRRFARVLVDRPGPQIVVWSDAELDELVRGAKPSVAAGRDDSDTGTQGHAGKYHRLWAWLIDQPGSRIETTFGEVEEIIGMRLPPSCRKHQAHWHSYEGSAVVRAVHDAGWQARDVSLKHEQITFVRPSDQVP